MTTTPRMEIWKIAPAVAKGMYAFQKAATEQGLDPVIQELVKIRASQINHCAFCIDMHIKDARDGGRVSRSGPAQRMGGGGDVYTEQEQAALALTEAVTVLPDGVSDEVYDRAAKHFEEQELAQLIALIFTINAWNRIGVTTRKVPGSYKPTAG